MVDWNKRFMGLAEHVSEWSKDRSTKVGCVIVAPGKEIVTVGYNGFARGVDDDCDRRHERPDKYKWTVHSELNALLNSTRTGARVQGCDLYVSSLPPCAGCANAIAQAGIKTVHCNPVNLSNFAHRRWREENEIAAIILREAGVEIDYMEN